MRSRDWSAPDAAKTQPRIVSSGKGSRFTNACARDFIRSQHLTPADARKVKRQRDQVEDEIIARAERREQAWAAMSKLEQGGYGTFSVYVALRRAGIETD